MTHRKNYHQEITALYHTWHLRTYRTALAILKSPRLAEEADQEVWLKVTQRYKPPEEDIVCQLPTITRNAAIDILRREGHYLELPEQWDAPGGEEPEQAAAFHRLIEAIRALPEDQRTVLEMKFLWGMTNRAIAQRLGMSESTVSTWVARGRAKLKEILKKEGYDL